MDAKREHVVGQSEVSAGSYTPWKFKLQQGSVVQKQQQQQNQTHPAVDFSSGLHRGDSSAVPDHFVEGCPFLTQTSLS